VRRRHGRQRNSAIDENAHPGESFGVARIMGDKQHERARLGRDPIDQRQHVGLQRRSEGREGLIEQKDGARPQQRARKRHARRLAP